MRVCFVGFAALATAMVSACSDHTSMGQPVALAYGDGLVLPYGYLSKQRLDVDSFLVQQYSEILTALEEPRLLQSDAWRFLWLRSFHAPVVIRAERVPQGCIVIAKEGQWRDNLTVASVRYDTVRLTADSCQSFVQRVEAFGIWHEPSVPAPVDGLDGAEWVFERGSQSSYALTRAWSPAAAGENSHFRQAGLAFLSAARMNVDSSQIY